MNNNKTMFSISVNVMKEWNNNILAILNAYKKRQGCCVIKIWVKLMMVKKI